MDTPAFCRLAAHICDSTDTTGIFDVSAVDTGLHKFRRTPPTQNDTSQLNRTAIDRIVAKHRADSAEEKTTV
jgi:hypothetical protein